MVFGFTTSDTINAAFQFLAAFFLLNNVRIIYRDKIVRGMSIASATFFFSWSSWNVWFFNHLAQGFSFYASIATLLAHGLFIFLLYYYHIKELRSLRAQK